MHTSLVFPPPSASTLRGSLSPTTSPTAPPAAPSCASSLKTASSYSQLSFVSAASSTTTMATTLSAATRTDMFEQVCHSLSAATDPA
ncbi:hypothetical protein PHLGIDRAFT_251653 [Phlebiopsis gigantea 11061_1 CR5-6]|uniref:Uncharacterized protein n=1 Tax=Phlebiopsis gigantea (strain 11061_1 CR5-6) TaxID=745531 RepID=A0A0C3S1N0_PHLG1|nr:hypothetical protein PHLGIDRAFT_251653 [Phlebiopsis gigantea 11061_1 CR5-6]